MEMNRKASITLFLFLEKRKPVLEEKIKNASRKAKEVMSKKTENKL